MTMGAFKNPEILPDMGQRYVRMTKENNLVGALK
jgi:hypothetical protein